MSFSLVKMTDGDRIYYTMLPLIQNIGNVAPEPDRPYTAYEILTQFYEENLTQAIEKFVRTSSEKMKKSGMPEGATDFKLIRTDYVRTQSVLFQYIAGTYVDFLINGLTEANISNGTIKKNICFRVRYILDMAPCHKCIIGPQIDIDNNWKKADLATKQFNLEETETEPIVIPTNDYLLPILYNDDYEKISRKMVLEFFPEFRGSQSRMPIQAEELAKRMGLKIVYTRLKDNSKMGQLFFMEGEEIVLDVYGRPSRKKYRCGTILINTDRCTTQAMINATIVHECAHMYLHRTFFLLQFMTGKPYSAYTARHCGERPTMKTALDWMEFQCEKLPAYILLDKDDTVNYVKTLLDKNKYCNSVDAMSAAINAVSNHYSISKSMAKYRLIELGYYGAEGIGNYIDGKKIPDHGCDNWKEGVTYTISPENAFALLKNEPRLMELLRKGQYLYVEGHFCINDRKFFYICQNGNFGLTKYARQHIDECCLPLRVVGNRVTGNYKSGLAAREKTVENTKQYLSEYKLTERIDEKQYVAENSIFVSDCWLWSDLLYSLPYSFKEALTKILKEKGVTQLNLATGLGVDRKVIYTIMNEARPSLEHVVAVCIVLKLPYFISEKLIELSGNALTSRDTHSLYRRFLSMQGALSLERCNDILIQEKFPPLIQTALDN